MIVFTMRDSGLRMHDNPSSVVLVDTPYFRASSEKLARTAKMLTHVKRGTFSTWSVLVMNTAALVVFTRSCTFREEKAPGGTAPVCTT